MYIFSCVGLLMSIGVALLLLLISVINRKLADNKNTKNLANNVHHAIMRVTNNILAVAIIVFGVLCIVLSLASRWEASTNNICIMFICGFSLVFSSYLIQNNCVPKKISVDELIRRYVIDKRGHIKYGVVYINSFKEEPILISKHKYTFIGINILHYQSTYEDEDEEYYIIYKNPIAVLKYIIFQIKQKKIKKTKDKCEDMVKHNATYARYLNCVQKDIDCAKQDINEQMKKEEAKIMDITNRLKMKG